jgi:hypothetical protein
MNVSVDLKKAPSEIKDGISQLIESHEYPLSSMEDTKSTELILEPGYKIGFNVDYISGNIILSYNQVSDAFRALGFIFGIHDSSLAAELPYSESSVFKFRAGQLESSRNGVLTVSTVKAFLRRLALMGINGLALYTEDTYQVSDEPYWGYLRGVYTSKELKDLDNYANALGIEMFPCIQTLGHLKQPLQWSKYDNVKDTDDILLVGDDKTYELISNMISSISSCFKSNRIHVGMDEAHGLGTGEYRKKHGECRNFDIINGHLQKVYSICKKMNLRPMIWSDMYFRLGSEKNDYYDLDAIIPDDIINGIPDEMDLVYWDYYHKEEDFYKLYIDKHRKMKKEPIVAPAVWTWGRFWAALPYTYDTLVPCLKACREKKVSELFVTTWGDDGMEVDIYSSLPGFQIFAELCYNDNLDLIKLKNNLKGSCNIDLSAYEKASDLDSCATLKDNISTYSNISKWLLWDDPLIGLCEAHRDNKSFSQHYKELANELFCYSAKDDRLRFPAQIAKVLSIKSDLRIKLVAAYLNKNINEMEVLLKTEIEPLLAEVTLLSEIHREMWLSTYKPFGLEVIDIRYGGLINRLKTLIVRIKNLIDGKILSIPEFETELLPFEESLDNSLTYVHTYRRIATPSALL